MAQRSLHHVSQGLSRLSLDQRALRLITATFIAIITPALLCMCLLTGPLQTLDETSHFFRAVQLSEGHIRPVVAPDGKSAGGYLDANLRQLGTYYLYASLHDWGREYSPSDEDDQRNARLPLSGRHVYTSFSNTVIYFPVAHAIPAVAILCARIAHLPPLLWVYVARLANAGVAICIYCIAIRLFARGRLFIFVLALLPRTMFGTASISADALLVPIACLFAGLLVKLHERRELSIPDTVLLGCAGLFIGLSKLAYIPLVMLPPIIAFLSNRRLTRGTQVLAAFTTVTLLTWFAWMIIIRNSAFPIRHDVPIDIYRQFYDVMHRPLHGMGVLMRSLGKNGFSYLYTLAGGQLGSASTRSSHWLTAGLLVLLTGSAFLARRPTPLAREQFAGTMLAVLASAALIFLLLYMQFTELGATTVDGVQGRYFLPLLPVFITFLPKYRLPIKVSTVVLVCTGAYLVVSQINVLLMLDHRYGGHRSGPGLSFSDPNHHEQE